MSDLASTGERVDSNIIKELMTEAIKAEREINSKKAVVKWTGRAISLIPYAHLIVMLAEEAAERLLNKQKNSKFNWLYALIDNVL